MKGEVENITFLKFEPECLKLQNDRKGDNCPLEQSSSVNLNKTRDLTDTSLEFR